MTLPRETDFPFVAALDPGKLPPAGDPDRATRAWADWPGPPIERDSPARPWLNTIFGNSPYLTRLAMRDTATVIAFLRHGPDALWPDFKPDYRAGESEAALMTRLRVAKRGAALSVALADLGGLWPLDTVTRRLSELADTCLAVGLAHLLDAAAARRLYHPEDALDPASGSGIIILGMGKLGAFELNYSSDIDLIILFESDRLRARGVADPQTFMTRLTRALARLIEERTVEGFVFRVDLRLRPDPASTPPAVSVEAAETYYASVGQNWERAALIKARAVAGDKAAAGRFMAMLRPFLWRRHLDFAAIRDIHSIKRQIDARQERGISLAGHNVKLGRGGIREIEFLVQTHQLIWGGRRPALRVRGTLDTLRRLAAERLIAGEVADDLVRCYGFLRAVEHRLQMVDDAQTHSLPADRAGLDRFARFMNYPDADTFLAELGQVLDRVRRHFAGLFPEAPTLAGPGDLVFTGIETDAATLATLTRLGFRDPERVAEAIRGWHHGRIRATRTQRARELLTELVPRLLEKLGRTPDPDQSFVRFDQFLGHLPSGVQTLSLFENRPAVIDQVARIMGDAPVLATQLARRPLLLDGMLSNDFETDLADDDAEAALRLGADLDGALARATLYEDVLDIARRWVGDWRFQIGVRVVRGDLGGARAGRDFALVAEAAIAALLPRVEADFVRVHGDMPGGRFVVLALGKLGGRELNFLSDLDLIFVYDAPQTSATSDGAHPLGLSGYYARLGQRLISALSVPTAEGALYDVDMRLRPSGNAGPIASSLDAFRRYHQDQAWTWEQMALTRARVVAGDPDLAAAVDGAIRAILTTRRDPERLLIDVAEMRRKIAEARPSEPKPWDSKHRRGALVDLEFILQYLILSHAADRPEILARNTANAARHVAAAGLLASDDADLVRRAIVFWHQLQQSLRVTLGRVESADAPADLIDRALLRAARTDDRDRAHRILDDMAASVLALYERLIDSPARLLKPISDT